MNDSVIEYNVNSKFKSKYFDYLNKGKGSSYLNASFNQNNNMNIVSNNNSNYFSNENLNHLENLMHFSAFRENNKNKSASKNIKNNISTATKS